ncbi:MAG: Ig-like domain-containing protein [Candidatus Latescibacteria bacterium]|nr:Ig-like domain-containing protein [Candidatus Latescibacterota bacterium]
MGGAAPLLIPFRGVTIRVEADQETVPADGRSAILLRVILKETTSSAAVVGGQIHLGSTLGSIVREAITDESGVAEHAVTSGTEPGTAIVTAVYGTSLSDTVSVEFTPLMLAMTMILRADPAVVQANGESKARIVTLLRDKAHHNPVEGAEIYFATTLGTIPASAITDQDGLAVVVLQSDRANGKAVVTARYGNYEERTEVLLSGVVLEMRANPQDLIADGRTGSVVTVSLKDAAAIPISGETIQFSTDLGMLDRSEGITDVYGTVTAVLTSTVSGMATVRAEGAGVTGSVPVSFTDYLFSVSAEPAGFSVSASAALRATLLDNNREPVTGIPVTFSTTLGRMEASRETTDASGQAEAILTSTQSGTALVTATAETPGGNVSSTVEVAVSSASPTSVLLQVAPSIIAVDGGAAEVTAIVTDDRGNPVADALIGFTFEGARGGAHLNPGTATTNANGVARTAFYSGSLASSTLGDVSISARVEGAEVTSNLMSLTISGAPANLTVGYTPTPSDHGDGTFDIPIAALVADINGNPVVDGTQVYFGVDRDAGVILSPIATQQGRATTRFTYPESAAGDTVQIQCQSGGIRDTLPVTLPGFSGTVAKVTLSATHSGILGDGEDWTEIVALVTDTRENPVGNIMVTFTSTEGRIEGSAVTEARYIDVFYGTRNLHWGVARVRLTSSAVEEDIVASVKASVGEKESAPFEVAFRGIALEVISEAAVVAAGGEHLPVTVTLKETTTHTPLVEVPLRFGTSLGTIVGTVLTDESGVAKNVLISGDVPGTATLTVAYGPGIRKTISVEIAPVRGADPASIVLVSAQPTTIGVKGSGDNETATIVFEVTDAYGMSVQDGTPIVLTLVGGIANLDASVSPDTARTVGGRASATLRSGTRAGTVKVVAASAELPDVSSGAVSVAVHGGPPDADHFSLAAEKLNIAGKRFSGLEDIITAYLFDQYSNPVPVGTSISFQTTGGGIEGSAVTNADGTASVKLISAKPWPEDGLATVTAQTVGRDGPIEATIRVLFSGPTAPISAAPTYITVPDGGRQAFVFFAGDGSGNPLVAGTNISVTAEGGSVTGDVDVTLPDTQDGAATFYGFIFEDEKENDASPQVKIKVTSQNGNREAVITAAPPAPLSVRLTADRQRVWADGVSTVTLTAAVVDMAGYPISGQMVAFSTDTGSLPSVAATDVEGRAEVVWTSIPSATDGSAVLIAQVGALSDTTTVTLQGVTLSVDTAYPTVPADGVSSVEVVALYAETATDAPIVGETIRFIAFDDEDEDGVQDAGEETVGQIGASAVTDASGQAVSVFIGEARSEDRTIRIRAMVGGLSDTTGVQMQGVTLAVTASSAQIYANDTDQTGVTARLTKSESGDPIRGKTIRFTTTMGTLSAGTGMTNANGEATVALTGGQTPGTATVTATCGTGVVGYADIEVITEASTPTTLALFVQPTVLVADRQSTSAITVTVTDQKGHPVSDGTMVLFGLDPPEGTLQSGGASTVEGVAQNTLISGDTPGTVTLRAWIRGDSSATVEAAEITYLVGPAATVTVAADSTELPADGITSTTVRVEVKDVVGNPVPNVEVAFASNIGNIATSASSDAQGEASVSFSSEVTGTAIITATVAGVSGHSSPIFVRPGPPHSILLSYDPTFVGVRGAGRNATLTVTAEVRDTHGNWVADGTQAAFSIVASPSRAGDAYRDELSAADPVPTVNGMARVSFTSGSRSGTARIKAQVNTIEAVSTEIQIFSGPPHIEDPDDPSSSHLAIGARPINILGWHIVKNRTTITVVVGDQYNNPVPVGTAVYFTTTGGVAAPATGYVDAHGVATVTLITGAPYPTVERYGALRDPNSDALIAGDPLDFDGDGDPNDGIARVLAESKGTDGAGNPAAAWGVCDVIFSGAVETFSFTKDAPVDKLWIGGWAGMTIRIVDVNGNPIVPGSDLTAETTAGALSWTALTTGDPGSIEYGLSIGNDLSARKPDEEREFKPALVTVKLDSPNGIGMGTLRFVLVNEEEP